MKTRKLFKYIAVIAIALMVISPLPAQIVSDNFTAKQLNSETGEYDYFPLYEDENGVLTFTSEDVVDEWGEDEYGPLWILKSFYLVNGNTRIKIQDNNFPVIIEWENPIGTNGKEYQALVERYSEISKEYIIDPKGKLSFFTYIEFKLGWVITHIIPYPGGNFSASFYPEYPINLMLEPKLSTGINDAAVSGFNAFVSNGVLDIASESALGNVALYNMQGQCVANFVSNENSASQDVSSLNKGIYILKVGANSQKIAIK